MGPVVFHAVGVCSLACRAGEGESKAHQPVRFLDAASRGNLSNVCLYPWPRYPPPPPSSFPVVLCVDTLLTPCLRAVQSSPRYALGMVLSLVTVTSQHGFLSAPSSIDLLLHALMLQSWVPPVVERGLGLLVQCWFLSNLFAYWLCFSTVLTWLRDASDEAVVNVAWVCSFAVPTVYVVVTAANPVWYSAHHYGSTRWEVDAVVLSLKWVFFPHLSRIGTHASLREIPSHCVHRVLSLKCWLMPCFTVARTHYFMANYACCMPTFYCTFTHFLTQHT